LRFNQEIRAAQVRVIGKDGGQVGIMGLREALSLAEKDGLDLVEISPQAKPPVCKIVDYGKFRYEQTKKEKESKKSQHQVKVKEIKIKPNIDIHDYNTKLKHARKFLTDQNKVRITCSFRGREMLHMELGQQVVSRFCKDLEDISQVEAQMKRMGRTVTLVLAPLSKKAINKKMTKKETKEEKHAENEDKEGV